MIYIDTSCLLKLIRPEPESSRVRELIEHESAVVISTLTRLEAAVGLKAIWMGGGMTNKEYRYAVDLLDQIHEAQPFMLYEIPGVVFEIAFEQHKKSGRTHCRSLDRIHLAAMKLCEAERLLTADDRQAQSASELGYQVLAP